MIAMAMFSTAYADDAAIEKARMEWAKQYMAKQGSPIPDSGITVIPEAQMSQYKHFKKQRLKDKEDIANLGYINKNNEEIEHLMNIKNITSHHYKRYGQDFKPTGTHLRRNINELPMAYTFLGVPQNDMSEFLGVAPYLSYINKQGWVGAMQFFNNNEIGNCTFSENNVRLSHGAVIVAKEDARNDVNDKTTTVQVVGTKENGFLYDVEWFDNTFFRELKCVNKEFSPTTTNLVIELAKRIDIYNSSNGNTSATN